MTSINLLYSYPLRIGVAGVGMTSWNQVNQLIGQKVKVHLAAASLDKPLPGIASLKETFRPLGIRLPIAPLVPVWSSRIHDRITSRLLLSRSFPVDAVHCWPLGSEYTLRAAKKLGIPTVLERPNAHSGFAFEVVRQEYARLGLPQPEKHSHTRDCKHLEIESREYALADRILCPSEFVEKTFRFYGYDEGKLARHHYGYDPEKYFPAERGNGESLTIVFVGRCEPRKGLHYALDAWLDSRASRRGKFYVCGDFVEGYRELLADKLCHPSIEIVGDVRDVPSYLHRSDALVLPSIEEGSALVTYEAKACGNTLLISDATGAQATHLHDSLIHKARDIGELTRHLDLLDSDSGLLESLKKNSLASAADLTWEDEAQKLVEVYRSAIREGGKGKVGT